ncbi:amino acid adenylation domain-containing protein [Variovorax sp. J22R133]|uniref:non-ribosomal peptide synthetase n=1 Tax=Variovorax brevis TaxID=3053503 RepID=UPI0025757879|nr:non-ribosomal peptide synthetase [Variovorax sp. J22R133]MDM0117787.1 amino acid adenylation domain-containing protein [Variovorax sp. J22R133]
MSTNPHADTEDFDPFATGAVERVIGSTEAQREIWLADRLAPEASLAYNESVSLLLRGPLSPEALRSALDQTLARHESLRASLSGDGMQLLIEEPAPCELPLRDLAGLDDAAREAALAGARAKAVQTRFDLERGPLLRAEILRCGPELHELLLTAHHIVCDGWSWGRIIEDLGLLYAQAVGHASEPLPAPARYEDYVQWENTEAAGPLMQEHTRFWVERFAGGSVPVMDLPTDRPRPAVRTFESRRVDMLIETELVQKVRQLGAASGASLFATLFGAFAGAMQRLTQQGDLVIGVAAAGQSAADMPNLVGHCVNVLPIRIDVDDSVGMQALVQHSGTTLLDAFEHQTMTYGALLKKLRLPRDPSRPTLVSVVFNLDQEAVLTGNAFPGLTVEIVANPRHFENFELFLNCTPTTRGLQLECQYNTGLFDEASVRRWLGLLRTAMQRFVAEPALTVAQAFALDEADGALLASFNRSSGAAPREELLHVCFERLAAAQPDAPALRFGQRTISYAELNAQANRIAHRLLAFGVRPDDLVGLCVERGVEMLAGLLGILKAGAAYVPLDPGYPAERLAHILRDSAPAVLLTQSQLVTRVPPTDAPVIVLDDNALLAGQPVNDPDTAALGLAPSHLAYVIYTSGSTGLPKGVLVEHRQVSRLFAATQPWFQFNAQDAWTLFHSFAFDFSVWEIWGALLYGGQLVVVPQLTSRDPQAFYQLLCEQGVTVLNQTPSAFRQLIAAQAETGAPAAQHRLRTVIFGGEKLEPTMLAPWYRRKANQGTQLVNMYGITETTVHVTYRPLSAQDAERSGISPIGQRIPDLTVHVLDAHRQPVPVGVVGELYVGGAGVARGYLNRPELNTERFIPDPFASQAGARLYKTGDLGRYRIDGSLEYLGRNDFQVKIRGFRIELGEIEARLAASAGVREATVIAREDVPGDLRLVGYVSAQGGATLSPATLRKSLAASLPEYMVPAAIIVLPALPLNASGKLDRKSLPAPELQDILGGAGPRVRIEPASDLERQVLLQMEQVLSLPGLSMEDDFFALGGHSLLAARLVAALGRALDMKLPLAMLFQAPTPALLARAIEQSRAQGQVRARTVIAHRADQRSAPLTPMQDRIRFIEELHPNRPIYNAPSGHRLYGPLDLKAFEAALREMVRRQPALRTVMGTDLVTGAPVTIVRDRLDFTLPVEDLRGVPEAERDTVLRARLQALADAPMDIHRGPLWRIALYRLAEQEHALGFVPHHLIWDGWSFDIFQSDLAALYGAFSQGQPNPLPQLPLTHGDYAAWYVHWLTQPEAQAQLTYWKERFARVPPSPAARTDMPRGVGQTGHGRSCFLSIDRPTTDRLHEVARRHDVTLNMLTLGVLALMMSSVIGAPSVVVATPVRGRDLPELEPIMGFFNNLVPIPLALDGTQTLGTFLQEVKRELVASMDHQQIPFEQLATEPEFSRRSQGGTFYQVLFSFQDARERPMAIGSLRHEQLHIPQRGATDDLGLWLMEKNNGLSGAITCNADIYSAETGETFRERYLELLQRVIDMPGVTLAALAEPGDSAAAKLLARLAAGPEAEAQVEPRAAPTALLTPEQAVLAQVWASVLDVNVNDIYPTDTFFDLGGDSLLAMRAVRQAEQTLGYRIEARRYLFESLAQLSAGGSVIEVRAGEGELAIAAATREDAPRGLLGRMKAALGRR